MSSVKMPLLNSAKIPSNFCMLYALSVLMWASITSLAQNQALKNKLDVNLCVPIVLETPLQTSPIHSSGPCYYLETDSKIYIFTQKSVTLDLKGLNERTVEIIDLPPGPFNLASIDLLLRGRKTRQKIRSKNEVKRSLDDYAVDDYDFNHLIAPPSGHSHLSASEADEQPDFGFRLAPSLAQAGGQQARPQQLQPQYQNDQPPSYRVDRRTQILPVPAVPLPNDSQARPVLGTVDGPKIIESSESQIRNQALNKPAVGSRPPTLRNPLDQIRVHQGKVFRIAVPANTFHDQVDGDTRHLRLELYTIDKRPVASDKKYSWIRFDPISQQFYGLPALANIGLHEFMLAAINRAGLPVYNAFTIYVQPRPKGFRSADSDPGVNHQFWVVLEDAGAQGGPNDFGSDFRAFKRNVSRQVEFFDALAAYYTSGINGSSTAANYSNFYDTIYLDSITRGSIRVAWLNDSLLSSSQGLPLEIVADSVRARGNNYSSYACPQADIKAIGSRFSPDGSGGVNPAFRAAMSPAYNVKSAGYDLLHACGPQLAPVVLPAGRSRSKAAPARDPIASRDYERDLWMTTIIPSLVMALLLLIASLIACCLYRRRRKPRFMNEDRSLFKKGVPVVMYPDEFEDSSAPPIDTTQPNVSYHQSSQLNPTTQNLRSTNEDNLNGYNSGSMRSPVNDPSASYPRPPPYSNSSYQPLLPSQTTDFSTVPSQRPIGPNVYSTLNAG